MSAEHQLREQVVNALRAEGISQAEVCRRLGCSTKHMSHMLTGKAPLSLWWAERILTLCGKRLVVGVRRL
ncbi:helix-turn-helix transcriptional regulator [Streptomyces werraensis]|uniref:helix-turn-helix transcriptional regulator n=1 Tax=Streptomyces werraensis TaxID=68284 RepID=UPI00342D6CEA